MHIDSPSFVRRKNIYSIQNHTPKMQAKTISRQKQEGNYPYGRERNLIAAYVNDSLNSHKQDEEILQKFRKEAEKRKKDAFLSKISKRSSLQKSSSQIFEQSIPKIKNESFNKDFQTINPSILSYKSVQTYEDESQQSYEIQRFKKLLQERDKQLKKRDRKIDKISKDFQKMSRKMKNLEQDKMNLIKEQEIQMNLVMDLINNMNCKIIESKEKITNEINKIKHQFSQEKRNSIEHPNNINPDFKNSLQKVKHAAFKIRQETHNQPRNKSHPSIIYNNQQRIEPILSSSQVNYLGNLNNSMLNQQKLNKRSKISFRQNQQE